MKSNNEFEHLFNIMFVVSILIFGCFIISCYVVGMRGDTIDDLEKQILQLEDQKYALEQNNIDIRYQLGEVSKYCKSGLDE